MRTTQSGSNSSWLCLPSFATAGRVRLSFLTKPVLGDAHKGTSPGAVLSPRAGPTLSGILAEQVHGKQSSPPPARGDTVPEWGHTGVSLVWL